MAWFIIQSERRTWTKYLVEAEDPCAALQDSINWHYLGYVDGEDTESVVVGYPYENKSDAMADVFSYVEG